MPTRNVPFRDFTLETFMAAIHRGKVALWSWDPVREIAYLDPLAMRFWDVDNPDMAMADLWERVTPGQRDATIAAWRASATVSGPYEFIFEVDRPRAGPIWIAARGVGNSTCTARGEVLAIFADVTDEVNARRTQQTLLREMGHRISNLFAVTGGILKLARSKHTDVDSFADDLNKRFAQLSGAYRAIMRTPSATPGKISVAEAITTLLAPYGVSPAQIRFDLDEEPRIEDQALTSLALILHELITNAMKYGALASEGGTLNIRLTAVADGYDLTWVEDSPHAAISRSEIAAGFGERLIRQTAQMAFGAEIERDFPNGGLVLRMTIPADRFSN